MDLHLADNDVHTLNMNVAFTMSINRAQGATMERVGMALRTEVFATDHMYKMLSRVSSFAGLAVCAPHAPRVNGRVRLKNIVARGIQF
uniref:ATP-dependent DNA helicase n=1 Tax=Ditylenchus dipsaci TaxID=166011 RepID=A0A915E323_9BILA